MKDNVLIREYRNEDKDSVLNLFNLNTPEFFSPEEEKELIYYLENEIEYYFLIESNHIIVGAGGINFSENPTIGKISWDMIHPDFQGKSLGSLLLNYRIERMKKMDAVEKIIVRTSQLAYQFYEKHGFQLLEVVENYWAKGFHLYTMEYVR
jgi:ribosomal protein S18 acetylase RimI-like enzyme